MHAFPKYRAADPTIQLINSLKILLMKSPPTKPKYYETALKDDKI